MVNTSIPYGINENGKEVHIDEVPKGKECNCICPECHKPLIAKKWWRNKNTSFCTC